MPTEQDVQTVAEENEYFPTAQLPVTADRPVVAQNDPALHVVHSLNPIDAAKVPVEQDVQVDKDADEVYEPTRQDVQTLADVAEYFPTGQSSHEVAPKEIE